MYIYICMYACMNKYTWQQFLSSTTQFITYFLYINKYQLQTTPEVKTTTPGASTSVLQYQTRYRIWIYTTRPNQRIMGNLSHPQLTVRSVGRGVQRCLPRVLCQSYTANSCYVYICIYIYICIYSFTCLSRSFFGSLLLLFRSPTCEYNKPERCQGTEILTGMGFYDHRAILK